MNTKPPFIVEHWLRFIEKETLESSKILPIIDYDKAIIDDALANKECNDTNHTIIDYTHSIIDYYASNTP